MEDNAPQSRHEEERLITVALYHANKEIIVTNVYAPSQARERGLWYPLDTENLDGVLPSDIITGDWNSVLSQDDTSKKSSQTHQDPKTLLWKMDR